MTEVQEKSSTTTDQKVKVIFEGETVDAFELTFKVISNGYLSCEASDGSIIEVKHGMKSIYRLCDRKKPDGSPIYILAGSIETKQTPPPPKE